MDAKKRNRRIVSLPEDKAVRKAIRKKVDATVEDIGLGTTSNMPKFADGMSANTIARTMVVANEGNPEFANQYILTNVHKLMMQGATVQQIGEAFSVSMSTASRWIDQVKNKIREDAMQLDHVDMIGDTLSFFGLMRDQAMMDLSNTLKAGKKIDDLAPAQLRYRAKMMEFALSVESVKYQTLVRMGVLDNLINKAPNNKDDQKSDVIAFVRQAMMKDVALLD